MRTIKFRGLDIKGNWYYGLLSNQQKKGWRISNCVGMPLAYEVRPETIGQFTDFVDKNRKEVFESDIVQFKYRILINTFKEWDKGRRFSDAEKETEWETRREVVTFENGAFRLSRLHFHEIAWNLESYDSGKYTLGFAEYHKEWSEGVNSSHREEWKDFEVVGNIYENPELLKQ